MLTIFEKIGVPISGFFQLFFENLYAAGNSTGAMIVFVLGCVICILSAYLLGSVNTSIVYSKAVYHDDIRKHGSGNAGLTNVYRTYGKKAAITVILGDVLKQVVSIAIGTLVLGVPGAYLSGTFCMIGHIAPAYYRFKGGKGVLTAATMVLLLDWRCFLVVAFVFAVVLLLTRFVSLASMLAAFTYPAVAYYSNAVGLDAATGKGGGAPFPVMLFAMFVGLLIIFMHRENVKRIFNGTESKFSFHRKPEIEEVLDLEDKENENEEKKKK